MRAAPVGRVPLLLRVPKERGARGGQINRCTLIDNLSDTITQGLPFYQVAEERMGTEDVEGPVLGATKHASTSSKAGDICMQFEHVEVASVQVFEMTLRQFNSGRNGVFGPWTRGAQSERCMVQRTR